MKLKLITEISESISINEDNDSKTLYLEGVYSSAELKNHNRKKIQEDDIRKGN